MIRRIQAFTLIELLVSILVIAIIIGITLPALGSARRAAHFTMCSANLRSIWTGTRTYADDHNRLPLAGSDPDLRASDGPPLISDALDGYLDAPRPRIDTDGRVVTASPWSCPADDERSSVTGFSYQYDASPYWWVHLIYPRYWAGEFDLDGSARLTLKRKEEIKPSRSHWFSDFGPWHPGGEFEHPSLRDRLAVYTDGHVDWFRPWNM